MKISDTSNDPWGPLALTNLPGSECADIAVIDAAMCTSAAPIYFPPYAVPPAPATPTMWCADGGLVANNPSSFTLGNVLKSNVVQDLSKVRMLSIGTGVTIDYVPSLFLNGSENDWGMLMWLNPLPVPHQPKFPVLGAMFDGQSQIADIEVANILGQQYVRANPTLPQTIDLADCSQIGTLQTVAQDYITTDEWKSAKSWAYENFV
jgi:patatin-like phospholipase/acyl hydrolase